VSSPVAKNIPLSPSGKSSLQARPIPSRERGVSRSSRTLGAGCGGRGSVGAPREQQGESLRLVSCHPARRRTALNPPWSRLRWGCAIRRCRWRRRAAYGEVVWSWHPLLMSSPQRFSQGPTGSGKTVNPRDDGDKKEFVTGESTKETVKTIVQGMPVDTGEPVVTTVCLLPMHTGGCIGHPAFPAPSSFGRTFLAPLGRLAPRDCGATSVWNTNAPHSQPSSPAKAGDPVFQRHQ